MGLGALEKRYFDLAGTLTEQDVREVVYGASDKQYMLNYLGLLQAFRDNGYDMGEPSLDFVVDRVSSQIRMYGLISKFMREDHSASRRETGVLWEGEVSYDSPKWNFIREDGEYVVLGHDGVCTGIFPVGLVRDLRSRELSILRERGEFVS